MKRHVSVLISAGMVTAALAFAAAGDEQTKAPKTGERSGQLGGTAARERELSGTVVKTDANTVYLEHMGAIVPMKIDASTQFSGAGVKSSRDLTEGQEVRASFTVKETTNVADRITGSSAPGRPPAGSGTTGMTPGPSVPPERGPGMPPEPLPPRTPPTPDGTSVPPVK